MRDPSTLNLSKSLNEHYQNGSYQKAIDLILKNKQNYSQGLFHEHLGTLYLKKKDYGVSRFHLEKAVKKGLVSTNVRHNLKTVKHYITTPDMDSDNGIISNFVSCSLSVPGESFLVLSLVLILGTFLGARFGLIRKKILISLLFVLSLIPITYQKSYLDKINYGIVLSETSLLEGPSKIYSHISDLEPGVKFIIGESKDGWYLISFPENLIGWVRQKDVGAF